MNPKFIIIIWIRLYSRFDSNNQPLTKFGWPFFLYRHSLLLQTTYSYRYPDHRTITYTPCVIFLRLPVSFCLRLDFAVSRRSFKNPPRYSPVRTQRKKNRICYFNSLALELFVKIIFITKTSIFIRHIIKSRMYFMWQLLHSLYFKETLLLRRYKFFENKKVCY